MWPTVWMAEFTQLFGPASGMVSVLVGAFTVWMLIDCLRGDPDRQVWWWLIVWLPGIGPAIYFFLRWLPNRRVRLPRRLQGLMRGAAMRRLESAAHQIGNAYQHVQLGDALRDTGQFERAGAAYARALEKEPENLPALWGAALVDLHFKSFDSARARLERILHVDAQYKFGDVSLAYGKALIELNRSDGAIAHLEKHVKRWRHPEGIYLLALLDSQCGRTQEARGHLQAMLAEIASSPPPIARKQGRWRRKGRQLLRKLGE